MTGIERTLQLKNFLIYNFVFWLMLCLWEIIQTLDFTINFNLAFKYEYLIRWPVSEYLGYWILSYMIFELYRYSSKFKKIIFLVFHAFCSLFFSIIHKILTGVSGLLLERLLLENETKTWQEIIELWGKTYFDLLGGVFIYWLVLIILLGLDYYRQFNDQNTRRLELESELGKAHLKTMKMQMNPHFLFNAFNTIAMMVRQKRSEEAIEMIGGLSDMFRLSLNKEVKQFVSLKEEVELLKKYLAIESQRYRDRLTVSWEIDEECLDCKVPNFVLQPIVENAFKHGISKTLGKAQLIIKLYRDKNQLIIEVFNTGRGLSANWELQKEKGIGLSNTIDRLLGLYKNDFRFLIKEKDTGVSIILKLPLIAQ